MLQVAKKCDGKTRAFNIFKAVVRAKTLKTVQFTAFSTIKDGVRVENH
jgi:hypothetical protein